MARHGGEDADGLTCRDLLPHGDNRLDGLEAAAKASWVRDGDDPPAHDSACEADHALTGGHHHITGDGAQVDTAVPR